MSTTDTNIKPGTRVAGRDGLAGEVEQVVGGRAIVRLNDGSRIQLPVDALAERDGGYAVNLSAADVAHARQTKSAHEAARRASTHADEEHLVIPVIEERVRVGKQQYEAGRVRIKKLVREEQQHVEQELLKQAVDVERVEINRVLAEGEAPPETRREGDVLVIPLLEERLVVEKRLVLREEVRVTRTAERRVEGQDVTVRREDVDVQRESADAAA